MRFVCAISVYANSLLLVCLMLEELYAYDFEYFASDTNFAFAITLFDQSRETVAATGSSQGPATTRSQGQVVNDAKVMEYMKAKHVEMKQELRNAQDELNRLRARPALATQREGYVLGEMDLVNRQLECKFESCPVCWYFA